MSSSKKIVNVYWYNRDSNFGDQLNPYLIPKLFGVPIKWVNYDSKTKKVFSIGSILGKASSQDEIWGSGLISRVSKPFSPPKIHSVRGPLTRARLLDFGIKCPAIYGDPALLLPLIYSPKIAKRFKIGVIPHYVDKKDPAVLAISKDPSIKIIDIQKSVESVISDVLSCEFIFSSSLHGLVVADAYGIHNSWIRFSNKIIGGDFKFNDYFLSVGRAHRTPNLVNPSTDLYKQLALYREEKINIDLDAILRCSPFNSL
jgi:pyruvyltransferase